MDQIYLGPERPNGADPHHDPVRATEQTAAPCARPVLKNIRIEDNLFIRHSGSLLHAHGVDGLVFRGNRVLDSTRYPVTPVTALIDLGAGMGRHTVEEPTPAEGIP